MSLEEDILIERFLRDDLSDPEKTHLLKRIESDINFRDKFLLEKQLFEALNEDEWSHASTVDPIEFSAYNTLYEDHAKRINDVIDTANTRYQTKKKTKRLLYLSSVAAIATLIIMINFYTTKDQITSTQLYTNYIDLQEINTLVNRNTDNLAAEFTLAKSEFENKNYQEALIKFDKMLQQDQENSIFYIYTALSQAELKKYTAAEKTLDLLINSDLIDAEKGYWYQSLIYIKSNKIKKAKKLLNHIVAQSYYKYKKAKELLEKIE